MRSRPDPAVPDRAGSLPVGTRAGPGRAGLGRRLRQAVAEPTQSAAGAAVTEGLSQSTLDKSAAAADADAAKQKQSAVDVQQAQLNLSYTEVKAPFDGIVSARQVSIGPLVGAGSATTLATIVQLAPIYVNFNVREQDVLRIRAAMAKRGLTGQDLKKVPVEVGLQNETGYPHKGMLDYASPDVTATTGTLAVRAVLPNDDRALLPGYFVRVRVPLAEEPDMLLVPDRAIGSDQSGRYVLVAGKDDVVEQRRSRSASLSATLRVISKGITAEDRVLVSGLLTAVPGQKIEPQLKTLDSGCGRRRCPMISKFFIERPVLANVIAILMVVIGLVSLFGLPVAQYPNVVPPTVQVTTRYPGASARTVIDTVALPIEQQVNGVEGMLYMQSFAASDGSYTLTVTFADRHGPRCRRRCWCRTACPPPSHRCRSRCRCRASTSRRNRPPSSRSSR